MSTDSVARGRDIVGVELPSFTAVAERGQLRFFAKATGQDNPIYSDLTLAQSAGYADLPVPPTFLFSLELGRPDPYRILRDLEIDIRQVLHGEQGFTYHRVAVAGEELHFAPRMVDYYEKRDGALRFLVRETAVTSGGALVAQLRNVIVVRELELT
jgi:hypothetical protein